ncbi:MAG TPA: hypothetical protein VFI52_15650 [Gemmatimonadaceae bacterium]|nr:hypothetical protein [Gemmatimonadaceae bacterium]
MRAGLTVVEVLAALVMVSVGLLGVAGTSALALRTASFASRERHALGRLQLRLATLAAAGCGSASSGSVAAAADGVREEWTVGPELRGAALVTASVEWRDGAGSRAMTARSAIVCR